MRTTIALALAALLTSPAVAASCRDAHGHFTNCPTATHTTVTTHTTTTTTGRCRDAKGHFAKCGTPGSHPA